MCCFVIYLLYLLILFIFHISFGGVNVYRLEDFEDLEDNLWPNPILHFVLFILVGGSSLKSLQLYSVRNKYWST